MFSNITQYFVITWSTIAHFMSGHPLLIVVGVVGIVLAVVAGLYQSR